MFLSLAAAGSRFTGPHCDAADCPVHDTEQMTWRHLNFSQHQAYLHARVPRVYCTRCGVKKVGVPWARGRRLHPTVRGVCTLQKDLAHCVGAQSGPFDHATTVDLAEQRAGDNFGEFQSRFECGNRAGIVCPPVWNRNLGAFTLRIRLGTLDEQLQAVPGPDHVFNIQPDEFGTAQRAREAEEKHCPVAGASEIWSAGAAQLADLGRGDGGSSPRQTAMLAPDAAERLADRRMPGVEGMAGDATRTGYGATRRRRVGIA